MNTEASQNHIVPDTTGVRLRKARETLGLTQQAVAERLCLKVSTIRDIEEDKLQANLSSTFQRGYIRSYAKLVHLPADELLPELIKEAPTRILKPYSMRGFPLGKKRKKRDGWLMGFTWLIVFIVLGLTGAWWWQNHQVQRAEITTMANQSSAQLLQDGEPIFISTSENNEVNHNDNNQASLSADKPLAITPLVPENNSILEAVATVPNSVINTPASVVPTKPTEEVASKVLLTDVQTSLSSGDAVGGDTVPSLGNLAMNFSADCWIQVTDANGKTLLSGLQKQGAVLNLSGKAPYKMIIGAPGAVTIKYQGKPVDLTAFIKSNRVARLTVGVE